MIPTSDVSVVMPVYGPPEGFEEAVASALAQQPGELILVDDASPQPVSPPPNVRLHRLENNNGPAAARNQGVKMATRPWLAFLDSDDLWFEDSLQTQLELLSQTNSQLVFGRARVVGPQGVELPEEQQPDFLPLLGAMVMETSLAREFPFEESLRYGEDSDFFARVRASGARVHKHPGVVLQYRQREGSLMDGRSGGQRREDFLNLVRTAALRRRVGREER